MTLLDITLQIAEIFRLKFVLCDFEPVKSLTYKSLNLRESKIDIKH